MVDSVAKQIALGASLVDTYISMQEYLSSLKDDEEKWGLVLSALLGAFEAMSELEIGAIGGKDSMSVTFNDIDVISTIVSFAFSTVKADEVKSREFKKCDSNLYFIPLKTDENGYPNFENLKDNFNNIKSIYKDILSISTVGDGITQTLKEMSYGNDIGFLIKTDFDLGKKFYGSFIVETGKEITLDNFYKIGRTILNMPKYMQESKKEHLWEFP